MFFFSMNFNKYITMYTWTNIAFLLLSKKKKSFNLVRDREAKTKRLINKKSPNLLRKLKKKI